jgi:hypothetical protein
MAWTTDFRNVYAKLISGWWGADPTKVIGNHAVDFTNLDFLM